jgi:hypothetical protein
VCSQNGETAEESAKGYLASRPSPELLEQRDGSVPNGVRQLFYAAYRSRCGLPHGVHEGSAKSRGKLGSFERLRQAEEPRRGAHGIEPGLQARPQLRKPDERRHAHTDQQLGDVGIGVGHEHDGQPWTLALEPRQQVDHSRKPSAAAADDNGLDFLTRCGKLPSGVNDADRPGGGRVAYLPSVRRRIGKNQNHVGRRLSSMPVR